jgi:hypothetical protein
MRLLAQLRDYRAGRAAILAHAADARADVLDFDGFPEGSGDAFDRAGHPSYYEEQGMDLEDQWSL